MSTRGSPHLDHDAIAIEHVGEAIHREDCGKLLQRRGQSTEPVNTAGRNARSVAGSANTTVRPVCASNQSRNSPSVRPLISNGGARRSAHSQSPPTVEIESRRQSFVACVATSRSPALAVSDVVPRVHVDEAIAHADVEPLVVEPNEELRADVANSTKIRHRRRTRQSADPRSRSTGRPQAAPPRRCRRARHGCAARYAASRRSPTGRRSGRRRYRAACPRRLRCRRRDAHRSPSLRRPALARRAQRAAAGTVGAGPPPTYYERSDEHRRGCRAKHRALAPQAPPRHGFPLFEDGLANLLGIARRRLWPRFCSAKSCRSRRSRSVSGSSW